VALAGDCDARAAIVGDLDRLAETNRQQIVAADGTTRQLGTAGAWATVALGLAAFGASAALIRRMNARIATPMAEIREVLEAGARGDVYRRCRRMDAPEEYGVIAQRLNQLLDRRLAREESVDPQLHRVDRALLHHLLDRQPEPMVAVDTSGAVIAASDRALEVLAGAGVDSLSDALNVGPTGDADVISLIMKVEPFGKQDGFLVTLHSLASRMGADEQGPPPSLLDDPTSEEAAKVASDASPPPAVPRDPLADGPVTLRPDRPQGTRSDKPDWERD
jgi:hypothetical protein